MGGCCVCNTTEVSRRVEGGVRLCRSPPLRCRSLRFNKKAYYPPVFWRNRTRGGSHVGAPAHVTTAATASGQLVRELSGIDGTTAISLINGFLRIPTLPRADAIIPATDNFAANAGKTGKMWLYSGHNFCFWSLYVPYNQRSKLVVPKTQHRKWTKNIASLKSKCAKLPAKYPHCRWFHFLQSGRRDAWPRSASVRR